MKVFSHTILASIISIINYVAYYDELESFYIDARHPRGYVIYIYSDYRSIIILICQKTQIYYPPTSVPNISLLCQDGSSCTLHQKERCNVATGYFCSRQLTSVLGRGFSCTLYHKERCNVATGHTIKQTDKGSEQQKNKQTNKQTINQSINHNQLNSETYNLNNDGQNNLKHDL
ncbi:hypothetical protein M0812_17742 [Anaeramoeba flamelloides]|uniref:Secreted protein n=1 Tax=Anaeramoeba flamelloides TaxID=1746091 RepID=A0AAV7Z903_9EUKA|nr:hypothetical protein M0812_17742 [Anaeramoeba flamelloides]